jgi:hypothetical protein
VGDRRALFGVQRHGHGEMEFIAFVTSGAAHPSGRAEPE